MKKIVLPLVAVSLVIGFSHRASAEITLYNNGLIDGTETGYNISQGFIVSDSFTLAEASTITGVQFGSWNAAYDDDATTSVVWSITSGPNTGTPAGTTATITSSTQDNSPGLGDNGAFNVFDDDFSTGSVDLAAGTYYLNLQGAISSSGGAPDSDYVFWDDNNGASDAVQTGAVDVGDLTDSPEGFNPGSNSESFQIFGTPDETAVPEPSGLVLTGIGVLFVGFLAYRRRQSVA